ncbi:hypothetical protein JKP88DRAFT_251222 [Tribonema minus]|uniref:Uncharacterized protein n=1 Tax=Tribonema minus TaxID=303371 RepID=A0A835ZDM2_9STRA|nr:hypothetical protein JKP88DRAFT_251222 [Tribonema minus]
MPLPRQRLRTEGQAVTDRGDVRVHIAPPAAAAGAHPQPCRALGQQPGSSGMVRDMGAICARTNRYARRMANNLLVLLRAAGGGGGASGSTAAVLITFAPHLRAQQRALHEHLALRLPPLVPCEHERLVMVQVSGIAGALYFYSAEEQRMLCDCLGLCPTPRTPAQEAAFLDRGHVRSARVRRQHRAALLPDARRCTLAERPHATMKAVVDVPRCAATATCCSRARGAHVTGITHF